jgi:predicted Zn-ribbon and HTH transcriptional regulator
MKEKIRFEEFASFGNKLKDTERLVSVLIEVDKNLPTRVKRDLFKILDLLVRIRIETRHEMMLTHRRDPRCQKCGIEIFEDPRLRVTQSGEVYKIKDNKNF